MVNGGVLYPPRLTPTDMPVGTRVISEQTSMVLRDMMRDVITIGTGKRANVSGYDVIGKTGSANKPARGGYDDDAHHILSGRVSIFRSTLCASGDAR